METNMNLRDFIVMLIMFSNMLVLGLVYGKPTFVSDSTSSSSDDPVPLAVVIMCRDKANDECDRD